MKSNNSLTPSYFQFTVFADYGPLRYLDLLSDAHFISRPFCFIQIFVIYTYASYEMSILCIMAYDRFVAICQPLHYHSKMTFRIVLLLLMFVLLYPLCFIGCFFYLATNLPLCGNKLHRIFCTSVSVFQLSCVDTTVISRVGQVFAVISIFVPLSFVLYTYLCILLVCRRSSSDFRGKALQTCLPHIVTFGNYCISLFCEVSLSQYNVDVNPFVIVFLSLEFLIIPPINNPLVYGLNLPQIRKLIFRWCKKTQHEIISVSSPC